MYFLTFSNVLHNYLFTTVYMCIFLCIGANMVCWISVMGKVIWNYTTGS